MPANKNSARAYENNCAFIGVLKNIFLQLEKEKFIARSENKHVPRMGIDLAEGLKMF
tara:strand:- start:22 stop:192 length:171 start_codon:yes stop_codon:yes gene_type:complete